MTDNLNINKLHATNKKLEESRIKTYDRVKKQCYNRINIVSQTGKLECWYTVPKLIVGFPPIDIFECATYLMNKLENEPIVYEFFFPNLFYISWDLQKIKQKIEFEKINKNKKSAH